MAVVRVETEQKKMKGAAVLGEGNEGIVGWVLAGAASVVATLSSTIAVLYRKNEKQIQEQIDELKEECSILQEKSDDCIKDREELRVEIAGIKARLPSDQVK